MHKSIPIRWLVCFIILSLFSYLRCWDKAERYPLPIGGISRSADKKNDRQRWFESMHRTAPGTDWRQLEYQNRRSRPDERFTLSDGRSSCQMPVRFADAQLSGRWTERGSNNQAGSIVEAAYDPLQDRIWLISAGGTMWSSPRKVPEWRIENQDLQFDPGFLQLIPVNTSKPRILAFSGQLPHFSDDGGVSWQQAAGIPVSGPDPAFHSPVLLPDLSLFVLAKSDYYHAFEVFRSSDRGSSFQKVMSLDSYHQAFFSFCRPHHSEALFLARKTPESNLRLQQWNAGQQVFVDIPTTPSLALGKAPANLIGGVDSLGQLHLFAFAEQQGSYQLHKSTDKGQSWKPLGPLPAAPWEVGLFLSPTQLQTLYLGEIEAFRTQDEGANWKKINDWWEYYDDMAGTLHADIMDFAEFRAKSGEIFSLISHHGGVSISYDQFETQQNIGLENLNTSQYYSVRTDPKKLNFVYAGSQDQGLQRAVAFEDGSEETEAFEQLISGDYGPIVFTRQATALWTVYPGGWINYYDNPQTGTLSSSFELISEDESVWFPPLMADPASDINAIYMGGGNLQGGPGSFLVRLEYKNKKLETSQINYDFKLESGGGELSALASAPSDPKYWYTATTNGRFFYSRDQGKSWEQSLNFIPEGHYLYGQAIYVSKFDPKEVLLAGSGYNNPPVYKSVDGGKSFQALDEGLPPTLIFSLAANADESLIFAATEAGPFVYRKEADRWFDLSTHCTPAQTYWSVEYIDALHTARFGTYGRGIWDLTLETDTPAPEPAFMGRQLRIFPNPTRGPITISTPGLEPGLGLMIRDAAGRLLKQNTYQSSIESIQMDLSEFPNGLYFFTFQSGDRKLTRKVILER